jgi:TrmH family RNA methyltransferase
MVLGKHNPLIRRFRALRGDGALRRTEQVFLAEGLHLAQEAIQSGVEIEMAVFSAGLLTSPEGVAIMASIESRGLQLVEVSDPVLQSVQDARTAQPVMLLVRFTPQSPASCIPTEPDSPLIVVAHGIQDPANLGSLMRTAEAAGATALLSTCGGADLFHPRTVRGSMGSIFRLPVATVELDPLLELLAERDISTRASRAEGGEIYHSADLTGALALFIGGEGAGLPEELCSRLDGCLRIPLMTAVESLAVPAAGAVLLFEAARQRATAQAAPPSASEN